GDNLDRHAVAVALHGRADRLAQLGPEVGGRADQLVGQRRDGRPGRGGYRGLYAGGDRDRRDNRVRRRPLHGQRRRGRGGDRRQDVGGPRRQGRRQGDGVLRQALAREPAGHRQDLPGVQVAPEHLAQEQRLGLALLEELVVVEDVLREAL